MNVIGMVCPRSGEFFAIEASYSDAATFQAVVDKADKSISFERTANILIIDKMPPGTNLKAPIGMAGNRCAALFARLQSHRTHLADDESSLVQQPCLLTMKKNY